MRNGRVLIRSQIEEYYDFDDFEPEAQDRIRDALNIERSEDRSADRRGFSRFRPASMGSILEIDGWRRSSKRIRLESAVRGRHVMEMVPSLQKPQEGHEYVLIQAHVEVLRMGNPEEAILISCNNFRAISHQGHEYPTAIRPLRFNNLHGRLYQGAAATGLLLFEVARDDNPLITYGRDIYGRGGLWWALE